MKDNALIIGLLKQKHSKPKHSAMSGATDSSDADDDDEDLAKITAAEELISAVEQKDAKKVVEAFEQLTEACSY